jgi:hypothetical protein
VGWNSLPCLVLLAVQGNHRVMVTLGEGLRDELLRLIGSHSTSLLLLQFKADEERLSESVGGNQALGFLTVHYHFFE